MKRKLTFLEGVLYAGGTIANNVVATVTIRGSFSEGQLQLALSKVQCRHPLLNVHIQYDAVNAPYFTYNEVTAKSIQIRAVDRINDDHWKEEFIRECLEPFDATNSLLLRVVWLKGLSFSDLVFVGHHCICDGKSILTLMAETLRVLGKPQTDLGSYAQFSSILDFVPEGTKRNRANQVIAKLLPVLTRTALKFALFKREINRSNPYFIHWKLSKEDSEAIFKQCKAKGLSVHAFLSVVLLRAYCETTGKRKKAKLFCSVDMRRFIKEVKDDMLFAFPAMVPLHLKHSSSKNIWEDVEALKTELTTRIEKLTVFDTLVFSEGLTSLIPQITKYAKKDRGSHAFTFSNMGLVRMEEQYGTLTVKNVYSPASIFALGNPSTLSVTSFKGQIDFIFTSDEQFFPYLTALAFRNRAIEITHETLGHAKVTKETTML